MQIVAQEKKALRNEDFSSEINDFKRSSLMLAMVDNETKVNIATIKSTFQKFEIPTKFNDHSVDYYFVPLSTEAKNQSDSITFKLDSAELAKKLIAKWFTRDKSGLFDLELIKKRGLYNASAFDIQIAENTIRGTAMLEDAGEELISNTFVIVNDYKYTNKEEVLATAKLALEVGSLLGSKKARAIQNSAMAEGAEVLGKGYVIKTVSYLYRLVWNQESANRFYEELWTTKRNKNSDKIKAFEDADFFKLEYVGRQEAWADVQSTIFANKTEEELIERATIKATDAAIAKLERKFEIFRTKTPLIKTEPLAAQIGTKEGLRKGDVYEVLEQLALEDGTIEYKKAAEITVVSDKIWNNALLPEEENTAENEYTEFKGNSKKLYPGMLIRYKRNKNPFK